MMVSFKFSSVFYSSLLFFTLIILCNAQGITLPQETQRAQCTVTAGEVKASAEATMTKTLEGVCGSNELQEGLRNIEAKLMNEIEVIKKILKAILKSTNSDSNNVVFNKILADQQEEKYDLKTEKIKINSKYNQKIIDLKGNRDLEVMKLNNTMSSGGELKLFSYYWQLENFSSKLASSSFELSPVFTILGKPMRIKAIFNHLKRDFLFLKLEQVSTGFQEKYKSIILDTGDIFKVIEDKISLKYKIAILDQVNPATDLVSHELTNIENGFLVPNSAILSNAYSKDDRILVKLLIYL